MRRKERGSEQNTQVKKGFENAGHPAQNVEGNSAFSVLYIFWPTAYRFGPYFVWLMSSRLETVE